MNTIFNLGSVNIDHVYHVPHLVRPGETLASTGYARGAGGKGFNQSVALARAGAAVVHIGCTGQDGRWLRAILADEGVHCTHLLEVSEATGHANIQLVPGGENAIVLHPGANRAIAANQVEEALKSACPGDWFLCQNETSLVPESMRAAKAAGLKTAYNAAPADRGISSQALAHADILIVNETEASELGKGSSIEENLRLIREKHPRMHVIATLGADGVVWSGPEIFLKAIPPACRVVDTTAAGDTFAGYCLAALLEGLPPAEALALGCRAAALCVSRKGSSCSIPSKWEIPSG